MCDTSSITVGTIVMVKVGRNEIEVVVTEITANGWKVKKVGSDREFIVTRIERVIAEPGAPEAASATEPETEAVDAEIPSEEAPATEPEAESAASEAEEEVDTPNPAPTPTATPVDDSEECYAQLHSFFTLWKNNAISQMVNLTAPSWRSSIKGGTDAVTQKLFGEVLTNRTPVSWDFTAITGTSNDIARMVTVRAVINKNNTLGESVYLWKVRMVKEDGVWYVDPATLQSNEQESTATPTNALATQPVLNTSHPDLLIYYNPEGGTYYHIDPNCESLNPKYRPLSGVIKWSQIEDDPYDKLEQCKRCGAPLREKKDNAN